MKVVALLLCLLLLLIAIPLVIWNLAGLMWHWSWAIPHAAMGGLVYLLIYLVGRALDRRFAASVESFLSGQAQDPPPSAGVHRVFGMLLITLLPYLLYLLALAPYASILLAVGILNAFLTMDYVPFAAIMLLAVVLPGSAFGFLSAIYHLIVPLRIGVVGVPLEPDREPEVWREVRGVAARLKTRAADRVVLVSQPGIGVYQEGSLPRLLVGGGRRVLLLGVPALHGMTVAEFRAALAHEYGHLAQGDPVWGTYIVSLERSLEDTCLATRGPIRLRFPQSGSVAYILALNPAYWILQAFLYLLYHSTDGFSRQCEVSADVLALTHYGRAAFCGSLAKAEENARGLSERSAQAHGKARRAEREEDAPPPGSGAGKTTPYDSHPSTAQRLAYAQRYPDGEEDATTVESLFREWEDLNRRIGQAYYPMLLEGTGRRAKSVPRERQPLTRAGKEPSTVAVPQSVTRDARVRPGPTSDAPPLPLPDGGLAPDVGSRIGAGEGTFEGEVGASFAAVVEERMRLYGRIGEVEQEIAGLMAAGNRIITRAGADAQWAGVLAAAGTLAVCWRIGCLVRVGGEGIIVLGFALAWVAYKVIPEWQRKARVDRAIARYHGRAAELRMTLRPLYEDLARIEEQMRRLVSQGEQR